MRRRSFVSGMLAGVAGTSAPAWAQGGAALAGSVGIVRPRPILCRIRPNIASMTTAQLGALKHGIAVMMARPANDPTSWSYQAAIHGSLVSPAMPLWNECEHGTDQFLSWHRLYLYRFERVLRKAAGSPNLTLPFWDWTAHRELPAPFRDTTPGNPLFTSNRFTAVNGGASLPASAVSYGAAFPLVPFASFSSSLEGTPHGAVHVSIGGWMSNVPTAAQDPIFWLHHANIDRLWGLWLAQGGGRVDPTTATWLNQTYSFFDENGIQVCMTARQTLNSCRDLGYVYEKVTSPLIIADARAGRLVIPIVASPVAIDAATTGAVELGPVPAEVQIPVGRVADQVRRAMRSDSGGGRDYLIFDNIDVSDPEGYYEVYLNPPPGKPLEFTDTSYVGNLVLFGLGPSAGVHHANAPVNRALEITGRLAHAGLGAINADSKLRVVLALREPEGAGAGKTQAPRARVARVRLLIGQ